MNPPFAEAKAHIAENITLLCHQCHGKKTRHMFSEKYIMECNAVPYAKKQDFIKTDWQSFNYDMLLNFGSNSISGSKGIYLIYNTKPVIWFMLPEEEGAPLRFSAEIYDKNKRPIFLIKNNKIVLNNESLNQKMDVTFIGSEKNGLEIVIKNEEEGYGLLVNIKSEESIRISGILYYGNIKIEIAKDGIMKTYDLNYPERLGATIDRCSITTMTISGEPLPVRNHSKITPNELCPCESGKKYKKCCALLSRE